MLGQKHNAAFMFPTGSYSGRGLGWRTYFAEKEGNCMKRKLLSLVLALVLLLCAACGSSGNDSGNTSASQRHAQISPAAPGTYYAPAPNYAPPAARVEMACSICNGSGRRTCSSCHGTGSLQRTKYAPSFGFSSGDTSYRIDITCAACSGTGKMLCTYCGGDGKL